MKKAKVSKQTPRASECKRNSGGISLNQTASKDYDAFLKECVENEETYQVSYEFPMSGITEDGEGVTTNYTAVCSVKDAIMTQRGSVAGRYEDALSFTKEQLLSDYLIIHFAEVIK